MVTLMNGRILEILGEPDYQKSEYIGHDNLILDIHYLGIMITACINRYYRVKFYEERVCFSALFEIYLSCSVAYILFKSISNLVA